MTLSRRTLLAAVPLAAATATLLPGTAHAAAGPTIRGADISFTLQSEAAGAVYRVPGGGALPLERAIAAVGANWVRLRLWNDPPAGYSDLDATITLAKRARAAGHRLLLDLHYADFWADPGKQPIPAAWQGQDLATLAATVRQWTTATLDALDSAGTAVDMVQIGNEITNGMLWPLGRISGSSADGFLTLLRAGIDGALAARTVPQTMVHIDRGGDNATTRTFFDRIVAADIPFDVIGQSYYPFWHGTLADLSANLTDTASRYGRPIVVVETAYPFTLGNADGERNIVTSTSGLPWPASWDGQRAYFTALRDTIARAGTAGFFAWEPGWLAGVGWQPGSGNPNDNLTLWNWTGDPNPALATAFRA